MKEAVFSSPLFVDRSGFTELYSRFSLLLYDGSRYFRNPVGTGTSFGEKNAFYFLSDPRGFSKFAVKLCFYAWKTGYL